MSVGQTKKKIRGRRRKLQQVLSYSKSYELPPDSWFDNWHTHVDWDNLGDYGLSYRKYFIQALCNYLLSIKAQEHKFPGPYQAWILFSPKGSYGDCINIHTPNPHDDYYSPFPWRVSQEEEIIWGHPDIENLFRPYLQGFTPRVGYIVSYRAYVIYCPLIGVPLEASRA